MDVGQLLVADSKTMEIMKPSMSTFDDPSILSKAAAMLGTPLCQNGFNTPIAQFLAVCFGVVSAIRHKRLEVFAKAYRECHGWLESPQ
jgi:hypothetical protein